jgi:hypothetical protein
MDCLDCHNRPAHAFSASAEREVDGAIVAGLISAKLPFIRREAVRALKATYSSRDAAPGDIERSIRAGVPASGSSDDTAALQQAIAATQAIYTRSVFPAMNITWGSYAIRAGTRRRTDASAVTMRGTRRARGAQSVRIASCVTRSSDEGSGVTFEWEPATEWLSTRTI